MLKKKNNNKKKYKNKMKYKNKKKKKKKRKKKMKKKMKKKKKKATILHQPTISSLTVCQLESMPCSLAKQVAR